MRYTATPGESIRPSWVRIWIALVAVYILWGTTYFAIKIGIGAIPPFLLVGSRFIVAGAIVCVWRLLAGAGRDIKAIHWLWATLIGTAMIVFANGAVASAERTVPTGVVAILAAAVPLWMAIFDAIGKRRLPSSRVLGGVALGFAGVVWLVGFNGSQHFDAAGALIVLGGSVMWALGSIASRSAALPRDAWLAGGMEMLMGGVVALAVAALSGEISRAHTFASGWSQTAALSVVAWAYLVVAGSVVGFNAYVWLLRSAPTPLVSTYAFVNPVIAFLLGWGILRERATIGVVIGAMSIVASVAMLARASASESQKARMPSRSAATAPSRAR